LFLERITAGGFCARLAERDAPDAGPAREKKDRAD
jgi:hypothetical protein